MKLNLIRILRRLVKDKNNTFISVFGLTIGMVAFLFILSWIISEQGFDRFWKDADQLYRVELDRTSNNSILQSTAKNYNGVGPVLQNELPEIESATHLDKDIITVFTPETSVQNVNMFFTDSSFFKVFPRQMKCENPQLLFSDIHYAAISRSLAKKLFGNKNPMNQSFKLNEGWEFYVKAVFDDVPVASHIQFDLILQRKALLYYMRNFDYATGILDNSKVSSFIDRDPYSQGQWKGRRGYTYIRLKTRSSIMPVKEKYANVILPCIRHINANNEEVKFNFMPVKRIHLHSNKTGEMYENGSYTRVVTFAIIGVLLLLTSTLNYVNLSVANSFSQLSIYNIRQVLGEKQSHVFLSALSESAIINGFAGIIGLALGFLILRGGAQIAGFKIQPTPFKVLLFISVALIIVGTVLGAIYPFIFISRNLKRQIASAATKNNGSFQSIRALVVFQFGISIFLIIGTLAIYKQLQFVHNKETGMNMEYTMVSFSPMTMIKKPDEQKKLETFRNEVLKISGVRKFTTAETVAGQDYKRSGNSIHLYGEDENKYPFSVSHVDFDYFDFFNVKLLFGNTYTSQFQKDGDEVILNEAACHQLGLKPEEAIGNLLFAENRNNKIIGVVQDHHHMSLRESIKPVVFFNSIRWHRTVGYYFIKIAPENKAATIAAVKKLWKDIYPQEEYHFNFLDDSFNKAYQADNNFGKVFLLLSFLTIFVASMGLLAMAIFVSKSRIKEIGIRKVNGAKVSEILTMLNKDFVKWVAIAFVLACPIAYYAMNKWLENFAYKTSLSWWVFALAGVLALGIALLTVSLQSYKAANRNPIESLRYE